MSTFTPPVDTGQAGYLADNTWAPSWMERLFRGNFSRAHNVWIDVDGNVTEFPPNATYNTDGSLGTLPEDRIHRFFQGAQTYTVTAREATWLTNAGYVVV